MPWSPTKGERMLEAEATTTIERSFMNMRGNPTQQPPCSLMTTDPYEFGLFHDGVNSVQEVRLEDEHDNKLVNRTKLNLTRWHQAGVGSQSFSGTEV
jgi:hypothetical protein